MTRIVVGVLAGLAVGAALTWTAVQRRDAGDEEAKTEPSRVRQANGDIILTLDREAQERAGLKTVPLEAAALEPAVKAYGHVLDPAPLAAQLIDVATARAALDASTKEFDRLKVLHAPDQNVSTRMLEGAEAALKHDQIALDAAQLKLVAGWGTAIAGQPDLPAFVHSLASLESALVRVDVPLGTALPGPPTRARLSAPTAAEPPVDAQLLGSAVTADPKTQGQGFLLLVRASSLRPGAVVTAWLGTSGPAETGVIVPRSAIVRHEGGAFVYVQSSDDAFERRRVELTRPTENGWFVDEPLRPGERAVVAGAQQLLSEELKGRGGEQE